MKLKQIKYTTVSVINNQYVPETVVFNLQDINLFIGLNGSGKSKALTIINDIKNIILKSDTSVNLINNSFLCELTFEIDLQYKAILLLEIKDGNIINRSYVIDNIPDMVDFYNSCYHYFKEFNYINFEECYLNSEELRGFKNEFLTDINKILPLLDIKDINIPYNTMLLDFINSKNKRIINTVLSKGEFKIISFIIKLNSYLYKYNNRIIVIDDFCDGLDFEKAKLLTDLILEKSKENTIQFILSTNDRFVMNKIPLENITIAHNENGNISYYDYQNSKEIFDDFKYTGLNNFDILSTQFYLEGFLDNTINPN
jgi:hypothetical protein